MPEHVWVNEEGFEVWRIKDINFVIQILESLGATDVELEHDAATNKLSKLVATWPKPKARARFR